MTDDNRFSKLRKIFVDTFESSEAQADMGAGALYNLCELRAGRLFLNGKAADSADTRAWIEKSYAFLLPPPKVEAAKLPKVDATILASATGGNLTALGKLAREVGADKARELVAAEHTKAATDNRDNKGHASNPWSRAAWSLKEQGAKVRGLGVEKAGQLAAAVGSHIGATRPTQ